MWLPAGPKQNFKLTTAIVAARVCMQDALNANGDQTAKIPAADTSPWCGVSDTDGAIGDTVGLYATEGDLVEIEVAAAVTLGAELMLDLTAAAEGRVKPATAGKQVVAICTIPQATIGARCTAKLTRYFKP